MLRGRKRALLLILILSVLLYVHAQAKFHLGIAGAANQVSQQLEKKKQAVTVALQDSADVSSPTISITNPPSNAAV